MHPAAPVTLALALTAAGDLILAAWAGHHQFRAERPAASATAAAWCGAILVAAADVAASQTAASPGVPQLWLLAGVFVLAGVMDQRERVAAYWPTAVSRS